MKVTIGIPFLNGRETLYNAIQSVFAQSIQDWELILADDGSSDGSLQLALSVRDPRVTVISDGLNRGVVYRHNQIAAAARGKYLAKLDDDDVMHPHRLQQQIQYLEANPAVDVVGSSVLTISAEGKVTGVRPIQNRQLTHRNVLASCVFVQPSVTGKALWFKCNPYDPEYVRAEDHELWTRTFAHSTFRCMHHPLTFYREGRSRTIRKYLLSGRSDRKLLARYGPVIVGWPATLRLIGISHLKTKLYAALWVCRLQELAFQNSRQQLQPGELDTAQGMLDTVLRTCVPGLCQAPLGQVLPAAATPAWASSKN